MKAINTAKQEHAQTETAIMAVVYRLTCMITGKIPKDCYWKTNLVFKVGGGGGGGGGSRLVWVYRPSPLW